MSLLFWRLGDLSWIIGGSSVYIRLILLTQNSYSLQRLHRDVTSPHFARSSHLPKSAVSCSFAFNGSSVFCFLDFVQSQKHSSLSSLAQLLLNVLCTLGASHQFLTLQNKKDNNKCHCPFYGGP